jgi:2-C-methyl-D-erythritol 4-phosphate cytidylyltransferase
MISIKLIVKAGNFKKVKDFVIGGQTRQESSYNGTKQAHDAQIVIVHDGARPFVTNDVITKCIEAARRHGGSIAAVPASDTMKFSTEDGFVEKTIDRDCLWSIQTPQVFQRPLLMEAHESALAEGFTGTDEASLVERIGKPIKIIKSTHDNIKVTTKEDLVLAEKIVQKRSM